MQHNFEDIEYLIGKGELFDEITRIPVKRIFDDKVISLLSDWSDALLKHKLIREYQDVAAFAFWIRRKSVMASKELYRSENGRIGRGLVFQIAPSNIPVQFAVTLVYALLAGNATVIRVSNKQFTQVNILCETLDKLLQDKYVELQKYILIVRYEYTNPVAEWLSEICDTRVIWGGNQTIQAIRKYRLSPRATELTFADRFSISVINADEYVTGDAADIAGKFYMDTYYVDQNACSSPRMVIWYGQKVQQAQDVFWEELKKVVEERYTFHAISATDKLLQFCLLAADEDSIKRMSSDNKLVRVAVNNLEPAIMNYKGNSGYFFEYMADELEGVTDILSRECQTIACYGVDKQKLYELIMRVGARGGDRIVDIGHVLDLSLVWDGYDMIQELSRIIQI